MVILFSTFAFFISSNLLKTKKYHPKLFVLFGGGIGIAGLFASSYASWGVFVFLFPLSYGTLVGVTSMVHVYVSWLYFPSKKTILTGV